MARVAIVGAGNLGAYLANELTGAGHYVFFCVRHAPNSRRFDGYPERSIPFFISAPPPADIVLLTVKTYQTREALGWLSELCNRNQPVGVIQNGVGHAARVAPYRAIPVLSYVYVEAQGGVYRAFVPQRAHFTIPANPACDPFTDLLAQTKIQVAREIDFQTAAWRKMLHNCVSNPLTALAGQGLEILNETPYSDLAQSILEEALAVAQAEGARLAGTAGDQILEILRSYPAGTRTSMLQDLELGKQLELDALNGAVIELGNKHGLPVAANEKVVKMLRQKAGHSH